MRMWHSAALASIPWLLHGTSTREWGSLRYPKQGEEDLFGKERSNFLRAMGLDPAGFVAALQVHGNKVVFVDGPVGIVPNCDGLATKTPGITLAVKSADCLPIFFVDPQSRMVAIAHAGWKGVASGIAMEAVHAMKHHGTNPSDLLVAIGPSVGPCHYRIHDERRDEMLQKTPHIALEDFKNNFVDLRAIVQRQLTASGVLPDRIDTSSPCTACEHDTYFSAYLGDDAYKNSLLSVISIRNATN